MEMNLNTGTSCHSINCTVCGGYIVPPAMWHGSAPPFLCICKAEKNNSWICSRCGSSNAPHRIKCDCSPADPLKVT
jgi:hypothetical protein